MKTATASAVASGSAEPHQRCGKAPTSCAAPGPGLSMETLSETQLGDLPDYDGHEQVVLCRDADTGLQAIIAIHSTALGASLGGCRMWPYATQREALTDALRLSQGMSYKHAMAGTARGGGKAVIIGDPRRDKSESLMRAFGRCVEALGGNYITAEDVGTSVEDVAAVRETTRHVAGLPQEDGGSGDPSPVTAYGVFCGIQAAVAYGRQRSYSPAGSLAGVTVAVQGVGHVGYSLCRMLHEAGARLAVTDVRPEHVERARRDFGAKATRPDSIYDVEADVFAPCALGAVLNEDSVPRLRVSVVAGAANNQLATPETAELLASRGIRYAPDYVINAGGVINISYEKTGYDAARALRHTEGVGRVLVDIFRQAENQRTTTAAVADRMARSKLRLS